MTTAVPSKPATTPASSAKKPVREIEHGPVSIAAISVVSNIRKVFKQAQLEELEKNIEKVGVLEPILLRRAPHFTEKAPAYLLIAGERRLRAAKNAGLKDIPARVLDVTNEQAVEIQAFENLHRADLSPIEEARAFKMLLDAGKYTVEQLAQRVDKSSQYVYRAVRLLELPENIVAAIEKGTLTPAHGHQILRVPTAKRGDACARAMTKGFDDQLPTAKELAGWVERQLGANLDEAVFPKTKPFAGEMACTACPYNTGNQGQLFDGAEKGGCTNSPCFDKKTEAHWQEVVKEVQRQHAPEAVLFADYNVFEGQVYKGYRTEKKVPATHKCKAGQGIVISKSTGEVWLASKPKETKQKAGSSSSQPTFNAKDAFIGEAVQEAVQGAIVELAQKQPQKALAIVLDQISSSWGTNEQALAVLGAKSMQEWDSKLKKASLGQIAGAALSIMLNEDPSFTDHFAKELGVNAKVAKDAKVEAAKEWDAEHPKEVAKAAAEKALDKMGSTKR